MPTATLPRTTYPVNLWDLTSYATDDDETKRSWYCLQSKPNQEKKAASALESARIPHFLPLTLSITRRPSSNQVTRSIVPLFTGYLFAWMGNVERLQSMQTRRLTHVIPVPDEDRLVSDLRGIAALCESNESLFPTRTIPEGAMFRVIDGPFAGQEGRVIQRKNKRLFVAAIHFLGQSVEVEFDDWSVERI